MQTPLHSSNKIYSVKNLIKLIIIGLLIMAMPGCKKIDVTDVYITKDTTIYRDTTIIDTTVAMSSYVNSLYLIGDVVIWHDTTINDNWVVAPSTPIIWTGKGHIHGSGSLVGGIFTAARTQWLFDSTFSVYPASTSDGVFSICWYGANPKNTDNGEDIRKTILTGILDGQAFREINTPLGTYNYHSTVNIANKYDGQYTAVTLLLTGSTGGVEDESNGSCWNYLDDTGTAINLQRNKGTTINGLKISGQFKPPSTTPALTYYFLTMQQFLGTKDSLNYAGITIDRYADGGQGGSTACQFINVWCSNFATCFLTSPNGYTQNAEDMIWDRDRIDNCVIGWSSNQPQEKNNSITNLFSWSECYYVIAGNQFGNKGVGQYTVDGANIAGSAINFITIEPSGWFEWNMYNIYAESIGAVGFVGTEVPILLEGSEFDFADLGASGNKRNLLYMYNFVRNGGDVVFQNDMFRIYNGSYATDTLNIQSNGTFNNSQFWGKVINGMTATYNNTTEWDNILL